MTYQNSFTKIKKNNKKNHHQLFNNQLTALSSSSGIDNIIREREAIFKKNPTVGLPEVSKLIESAIHKRQRDQRKHNFFEKKRTQSKGKRIRYEHSEISHHLMDRAMKQLTHQFYKIFFHISKCLACNAKKTLQLKITKKRMNIANFINIYI